MCIIAGFFSLYPWNQIALKCDKDTTCLYTKANLKFSSAKCRSFCFSLDVLVAGCCTVDTFAANVIAHNLSGVNNTGAADIFPESSDYSPWGAKEYLSVTRTRWAWMMYGIHMGNITQSISYIKVMCIEQGPLLLTWIILISAWISNHMPSKVWDEITFPFLNFNGATVEV